jgi:hypothetical protein
VLLFRETSEERLAAFLAADPFTTAGLVRGTTVIDWSAGLGVLTETG